MDKVAFADNLERKGLFIDVADKTNISNFIIEKDFWVSWILERNNYIKIFVIKVS